jgi:menaquinol-cytochrome c reductase cytochrome b/c subunit
MPTPDEVFEQVLADEQAKGSSPAVAQARAKAARVRAQRGSANPAKPDPSTAPAPQRGERAAASAQQPAVEQPAAEAAPRPAATARPAAERSSGSPSQTGAPARRAAGNGTAAVPERVQRLLAVVKPEAIQKVERQPMDRVNVWPHLMAAEFISLLVVTATITFFSVAVDAPLRELANFNQTPNPSKAPWYFLGLQELLRYFHPQVAGVTIPTVIIIGLMAWPFLDRNPSTRPDDRKLAIVLFSFFMLTNALLVIFGMFFRGPGFNWVFPWQGGIFFEL